MVSILICSTNSNNYKKPAYDNGFYAKSHFVDNVCCSITNNETSRNCSISAPVRLTSRAKLLSQMNPIAGSMSVDSRSVEIQAREEINVNVKKLEIDDLARRVAYTAVLIDGFGSGHRGPAASREHRVGRWPRGQRGSGG